MSENSPPTPVNATIDLEQLQSLIAAQAQVNSTQEFGWLKVGFLQFDKIQYLGWNPTMIIYWKINN